MPGAGDVVGHYRIERKLGEGAFGNVFLAEDIRLHRKLAVKILRARTEEDPEAWGRLLREARAASALNHQNICALYDIGEEDGLGYIAMEYVEGRSLGEILREGPVPAATAFSYAIQVVGALAHAHRRGIVHRDLKSSNVMITPDGCVKLLDFGLARRLDSQEIESVTQSRQSLTDLRGLAGTLCYMAPEVLRGRPADTRSDLWALGALLYETVTGTLPFRGETPFELSLAIMVEEPPPLPPRVPPLLRAAVVRCLEKEPKKRYDTCEELLTALEQARAELKGRIGRFKLRNRSLSLLLAGLAIALAVGLGFMWRHQRERAAAAAAGAQTMQPPPPKAQSTSPLVSEPAAPMRKHAPPPTPKPRSNFTGNPNTEVWVNPKSKVYHCPGTRWYQKTADGELEKQRQAQLNGYHPASGRSCP